MGDLCTDLRRVSSNTDTKYTSLLTQSFQQSAAQTSPWLLAAEQLKCFPTKRCVQMKPEDYQELSGVLQGINRMCMAHHNIMKAGGAGSAANGATSTSIAATSTGAGPFTYMLELLLRIGQVTSCLLCVNGDDPSFSIARVAQVGLHVGHQV